MEEKRFCIRCGKPCPPGQHLCPQCAQWVQSQRQNAPFPGGGATPQPPKPASPRSAVPMVTLIVAGVVGVLLIGAVLVYFLRPSGGPASTAGDGDSSQPSLFSASQSPVNAPESTAPQDQADAPTPSPSSAPSASEYRSLRYTGTQPGVLGVEQSDTAGYRVLLSVSTADSSLTFAVKVSFDGVITSVEKVGLSDAWVSDPTWLSQFRGASDLVALTSDGGAIDPMGDSASAQAVCDGVNHALLALDELGLITVSQPQTTHRYEIVVADVTWWEAYQSCLEQGGHLATITSQEEYDRVVALADQAVASGQEHLTYLWIGGKLYSENDLWGYRSWITGEDWTFDCWYPGEPSYLDNDSTLEEYLCLWHAKYQGEEIGWTFNDQRNDIIAVLPTAAGKVGYICEYDG